MTLADRILKLRKLKGISQEELAGALGVSRQAVSKWESEQSVPDIERVLSMCDYFEVTADYLLRGVENETDSETSGHDINDASHMRRVKNRVDARLFAIVGTAMNFVGLMTAIMIWKEDQLASSVVIGLIVMAFGCMIHGVGLIVADVSTKPAANRLFLLINVWILLLMPLAVCFNLLDGFFGGYNGMIAPYPLMGNSLATYFFAWALYIGMGAAVDFFVLRKMKHV